MNCSRQLLEHGFFPPTPIEETCWRCPPAAYLDFGMMSEVSRESRAGLIKQLFT